MRAIVLSFILAASSCFGTNFYVRPSAAGTSGADWNNAWSLSTINWNSVNPGDTIWMAGGTYPSQLNFGASGQTNNPITVRKVIPTDSVPTSAAGYLSSFGSSAAILPPILSFKNRSFVTLDGGVDGGFQINSGGGVGSYCIQMNTFGNSGATVYQETIKHLTMYGAQRDGNWDGVSGTGGYGIDISSAPGGSASVGFLISHCTVNGVCELFTGLDGVKDLTIEYCNLMYSLGNSAPGFDHPDIVYIWNFNGFVMRYNWIYGGSADGIFWGGSGGPTANFKFYGNVCVGGQYGGNGPCLWINPSYGQSGFEVYNNTFVGPWSAGIHNAGGTLSFPNTNNLFWNCGNEAGGGDYNFYNVSGNSANEPHRIISAVNPFINNVTSTTNGNFRLLAGSVPVSGGATLPSPYTTDPDGNTRTPNSWSIGTYQFGGSASTNPVTQVSTSSLNFGVLLTNTSSIQTFSILNAASGANTTLTGSVSGLIPPFSFTGPTNYSLNNGQSFTVSIKYSPAVYNGDNGSITLVDNGGGGAVTVTGHAGNLLTSPFLTTDPGGTLFGQWSANGAYIYQTTEVPINDPNMASAYYWFSVPTTTNYTITAQVIATSSAANSFWLNVDSTPTDPAYIWDITPPIPVVTNAAVSLRGTGGETNDQFNPAFFHLTAGNHLLILYGREANAQVSQFAINGPSGGVAPTITSGPNSVTNDVFQGFQMSVTATGTTPLIFQWTSNGVALANQTNTFYSAFPPNANTNTYACIVTNLYGAATNSAFGVLTNGTVPTFSSAPPATFVNSTNGGINIKGIAIGTAPLLFHWKTNSVLISGATSSNYVKVPVTPAQTNTYVLQVDNHYGTLNSAGTVVSITNGVTAAIITNQPAPVTGLRILGFSLSVGADGTPPLSYQWQKNSNNIAYTGSSMTIPIALASDSGYYRCGVSNIFSSGYVYSANALVTMTNGTVPVLNAPTNWTAGTNVGIYLYSSLASGDLPVYFQWSVGGTNLPGQTSTNLVLPGVPAQTNTYTITATNFEGANAQSAVVKITNSSSGMPPLITTQPLGITNSVSGFCKQIFITVSGTFPFSYQWRQDGVAVFGQQSSSIYFCPLQTFNSGAWDCVVTNISGSVTSAVAQLLFTNVIAPPIAVASSSAAGRPIVYAFSPISFSSAGSYSPSGLALTFLWNFGDGTTDTNANPIHSFSGGTYAVRMSVSDGVNPPVFATDINLLIQPFSITGSGYYKKIMF